MGACVKFGETKTIITKTVQSDESCNHIYIFIINSEGLEPQFGCSKTLPFPSSFQCSLSLPLSLSSSLNIGEGESFPQLTLIIGAQEQLEPYVLGAFLKTVMGKAITAFQTRVVRIKRKFVLRVQEATWATSQLVSIRIAFKSKPQTIG